MYFLQEADNRACDSAMRQGPNFPFTRMLERLGARLPGFGSSSQFAHLQNGDAATMYPLYRSLLRTEWVFIARVPGRHMLCLFVLVCFCSRWGIRGPWRLRALPRVTLAGGWWRQDLNPGPATPELFISHSLSAGER